MFYLAFVHTYVSSLSSYRSSQPLFHLKWLPIDMACKVVGQRINLLTAYFLIQVGSEENESLSVWTPFFRGGDEMVKWSNTLSCGEAIGAVPGSNPQNIHSNH